MIIDEEIKLKRLQTIEAGGHRASIKNRKRDYIIMQAQRDFTNGRLVNNKLISLSIANNCCNILQKTTFNYWFFYLNDK